MVINDKVAFIPIPKNASWSVEDTCISYKFNLKYSNVLWENSIRMDVKDSKIHIHSTIDDLINKFGKDLEYVAIIRNSTDRFISAWKFFVKSITVDASEDVSIKIKSVDNKFIINFIKENYTEFIKVYSSADARKKLLIKLVENLGVVDNFVIDKEFIRKFSVHILTFASQYYWIYGNGVKVKEFSFDRLDEFEKYMSDKFDVDFKLIHANKDRLDYCAVTKTDELIEFVDKYIDGAYKRTKSLI